MNILGVITARGGSKGLPGKNIKELGGKPLIVYSIEAAQKSKLITHLIVSTDSEEIADVCKRHGADVPFLRPKELAEDMTPHLPVMQHAVTFMEKKLGIVFDYVVILQPTSPLRTVEDIDGTIQKLIDTNAGSAVSLVEITENHPIRIKKFDGDLVVPYCRGEVFEVDRRQDLPVAYKLSGAAYAMKRDTLLIKNVLWDDEVTGYIVPQERSISIDTIEDWKKTEKMFNELVKKDRFI